EIYQKGLKLAEKINNKDMISKFVNNLGAGYLNLGQFDMALKQYRRSIELARKLGNEERIAIAYDNIGVIHQRNKEYEKALESHTKALEISKKLNDRHRIATCYENLGVDYAGKSDSNRTYFDLALENYNKALEMHIENGLRRRASNCLYNLASLYYRQKDYDKALELAEKSHKLNLEVGGVDNLRDTYNLLADCYEKKEKYKEAHEYYKNYKKMFDSLINVENVKKITQIEMRSEFDQIQKEREFEQRKKDILKEAELQRQKNTRNYLFILVGSLVLIVFIILRNYRIKQRRNALLARQKDEIENKNTQITDSIKYARRIQQAILPPDRLLQKLLPDAFVFYKPKDIVSGDFYWIEQKDNRIMFAVVDCTGHGVPGAFISIVGHNGLNRAINEFRLKKPAAILDKLNEIVNHTLRQSYEESAIRDGLDIALCSMDKEAMSLEYAGAYNPLYIIREKRLIEIKADKQPVGQFIGEAQKPYTNHTVPLEKEDMIYLFSDGYPDQFGGDNDAVREQGGEKYKLERIRKLLISVADKSPDIQKRELERVLAAWQGNLDQLDDICVMGVKV
ncbi:MAG: tetratricopeptide repeat protein, partial [Bacteroidetes bacterium]|nr:tetratricopeptide repeat protein [Bacteroidota bacterium]